MGPVDIPVVLVAAGLIGIGVIALMLGHREAVRTGPLLILHPSYDADISTVQNQIQAVTAIAENMRELNSAQSINSV